MPIKTKSLTIIPIALAAVLITCAVAVAQQITPQTRTVQPVSVSGDLLDITRASDGRPDTRATSDKADYAGASVLIDIGSEQNIIGVIQDHGRWPTSYAGAYSVEVAASPSGPWLKTFEGAGQRGESKSLFEAVRARYIRITATKNATLGASREWSIAEIRVGVDPSQKARSIPSVIDRPSETRPGRITGSLKDIEFAIDKNIDTRAMSGDWNYAGTSFIFDLGGEYELSRVVQMHGRWSDDYPGQYKVEVSRRRDESDFREVWRGPGAAGRSVARFNPIITRYVRVTAVDNHDRAHWWSIAELRTNRDEDVIEREDETKRMERPILRATASGLSNINAALDGSGRSRATTGKADYVGSWVLLDLGGNYTISKVLQVHNPDEEDYPGRYKVEVSEDGRRWQTVWEGEGERGRSNVSFAPVRARYVRLTATAERNRRNWWSIYKLEVQG